MADESETDTLRLAVFSKGKIMAGYSHDAASALKVFSAGGEHLYDAALPIQSQISFSLGGGDSPYISESGILSLNISSFINAGDDYKYDIDKNTLSLEKKGPVKSELEGCIVERLSAPSKDGTLIPMTVIRSPETKLDGTAAVKIYGYGSFGVRLGPSYDPNIAQFVKAGGVYVQANLRGGGEFGQEWHDQGRLDNKQHTFDDLVAVAEGLVEKNYTTPKRIVIEGGSAGGLLTAATAVQRPDLFGAAVVDRGLTDMIFWPTIRTPEFGDPLSSKEDFNTVAAYSPVQNVKHGAEYPPMLIITADHDDRVEPSQPYRFAAALQIESDPNNVVMLHVEKGASHTTGKDPLREKAKVFAFIEKAIGPVNQNEYKKSKLAANASKRLPSPPR